MDYFAHDICGATVTKSLFRLENQLQDAQPGNKLQLQALVSPYETCFDWLQRRSKRDSRPLVVIWLGNSLAHLPDDSFAAMIERLTKAMSLPLGYSRRRAIISVDACKDIGSIEQSYNSPDGSSTAFVANALQHANNVLGQHFFQEGLWEPVMSYLPQQPTAVWYCRAARHHQCVVDNDIHGFEANELVEIIRLHKRDVSEVRKLVATTCAHLLDVWKHPELDWSECSSYSM